MTTSSPPIGVPGSGGNVSVGGGGGPGVPVGGFTYDPNNWTVGGSTITFPSNVTYAAGTAYIPSTNFTSNWVTTTTANSDLHVHGDIVFDDGTSLKGALKTIMDRLAILQPDKAKLEKYEALKKAYEHYKTLERLCMDPENTSEKK